MRQCCFLGQCFRRVRTDIEAYDWGRTSCDTGKVLLDLSRFGSPRIELEEVFEGIISAIHQILCYIHNNVL